MKTFFAIGLLFGLFVIGCGKNEQSGESSPITAPVDYLGAVGKAKITAEKTVDTVALNQAIQMFQVQEGRNPKDLNELVEKGYLPHIQPPHGMKFVYDPNTGSARVVRQ